MPHGQMTVCIFAVLVSLSLPAAVSFGQNIPSNRTYSIVQRGIPLNDALQQFITVTAGDISISWDPLIVSGKRAFCVIEDARADALLNCILRGTGLDYVVRSNGLYVVGIATEGPPLYGNLRGIILDRDTEQPVSNATVYLAEANRGVVANYEGMFIFPRLLPGSYNVRVQHIGYRTRQTKIEIDAGEDASTEIILESESILITTPLVIDGRIPSSSMLGAASATQEEIVQNLAAGTSGLLQSLDAMPGVRVNDTTADIHIQGGEAGEHQFRLDGTPIFLPLNVASFIGPFSPFALGKITVHKAGFSARLGSQISGIISAEHDLRIPFGSAGKKQGTQLTFQVDPLSTNGRYSGFWDLSSGKHVTVLGSARLGTWSLLAPPALSRLMDEWNTVDTFLLSAFAEQNTPFANLPSTGDPAIQFADVHAASKVRFGALKTWNTSAYWGRSSLGNSLANIDILAEPSQLTNQLSSFKDLYSWQTAMAQSRLEVVQSAHALTSIGLKSSFYKLSHDFEVPDDVSNEAAEDDGNQVYEVSVDGSLDYFSDSGMELDLGAEATVTGTKFTVAGT
ncbi:MAG: carboxypeptidase-like regulatory domain-containing protein [Bacteroidetes bacterium]|nr:carboxypeptidase-like regulatory domain-containing protein [Bacteroidota bacterium]